MIEPGKRLSIFDLVRPPGAGWAIDAMAICTYSASLETVLSLPAAVAIDLPGPGSRSRGQFTGFDYAALKKICGRTAIFCQRSAIHPAEMIPAAIIEAESMVYEVDAPSAGGSFHPKLWVIRFAGQAGARLLRLCISSRNLTPDRSWDLAIVLEGSEQTDREGNDLGELLRALPAMCRGDRRLRGARLAMIESLAGSVERMRWTAPAGLGRIAFHALGLPGLPRWSLPASDRLAILSPFLNKRALDKLLKSTGEGFLLLSRKEALDRTWSLAGAAFRTKAVLAPPRDPATGAPGGDLHAKAYVWQKGRRSGFALGSMNATDPATDGRNVEFMASFDCTRLLGKEGIEALARPAVLGAVMAEFAPLGDREVADLLPDDRPLRRAIADLGLHLACWPDGEYWRIALAFSETAKVGLPASLTSLSFRPATLPSAARAPCLASLRARRSAPYPTPLPLHQVTGFVVVEAEAGGETSAFTLNLEVRGVDEEERRTAALRAIIPDQNSLLDLVRAMLGDFSGLADGGAGGSGEAGDAPAAPATQTGLLELLVRCAADEPERLHEIGETLRALGGEGGAVWPEGFEQIWRAVLELAEAGR